MMITPLLIEELARIPTATFIVISMALGVNLLFAIGRRLLTDVERTRRIQAEIKQFHKELREAITTRNKAKEEKLRKKKQQMDGLQAKMTFENLKVTFLFFIPLMLLWWFVSGIVGADTTVAISPIPINLLVITIHPNLNLFWFYMISSFAFSGVITKVFGVGLTT